MVREFIRTFQTNLFNDNDFYAVQACCKLLMMLLTYHDPPIFRHLESCGVIPEMFALPWFVTYFASRVGSAEIILELWDRMSVPNQHQMPAAAQGQDKQ